MITAIQNIISSPVLYNATQSTITQISTETTLKAIGRPAFIVADKNIDSKTKKYSSVKEFLYQMTCLGIYLLAVMPLLRKGTFKVARKMFKNEPVFQAFKTSGEFKKYHAISDADKLAKIQEINQNNKFNKEFKRSDFNENLAKGVVELSSIIGSVTGLAIIAPIVSHPLIRPILSTLGLNKDNKNNNNSKIDKVA